MIESIDIGVSGCALILSVLEEDMQSCLKAGTSPNDKNAIRKMRMILSKDHLQELVSQLRGQQQAIGLLIGSLQSQSIEDMKENLEDSQDVLYGMARNARRLYEDSDRGSTYHSTDMNSIVTSTRFEFDAEVLASGAYRRVLEYSDRLNLRQQELSGSSQPVSEHTHVKKIFESSGAANERDDQDDLASERRQELELREGSTLRQAKPPRLPIVNFLRARRNINDGAGTMATRVAQDAPIKPSRDATSKVIHQGQLSNSTIPIASPEDIEYELAKHISSTTFLEDFAKVERRSRKTPLQTESRHTFSVLCLNLAVRRTEEWYQLESMLMRVRFYSRDSLKVSEHTIFDADLVVLCLPVFMGKFYDLSIPDIWNKWRENQQPGQPIIVLGDGVYTPEPGWGIDEAEHIAGYRHRLVAAKKLGASIYYERLERNSGRMHELIATCLAANHFFPSWFQSRPGSMHGSITDAEEVQALNFRWIKSVLLE